MATIEKFIPFIISHEAGDTIKKGETAEQFFERRRKAGFADDKDDRGRETQTGVTIATYKNYCAKHGISEPTVANLKAIPYATWRAILKELYWDRWKADQIVNQGLAEICVDWVWASGSYGITKVQTILGVKADGIVGAKTLAAINNAPSLTLFYKIKNARVKFIDSIVKARPKNQKFYSGWLKRINEIKYYEV